MVNSSYIWEQLWELRIYLDKYIDQMINFLYEMKQFIIDLFEFKDDWYFITYIKSLFTDRKSNQEFYNN